jgi:hypothetical protein
MNHQEIFQKFRELAKNYKIDILWGGNFLPQDEPTVEVPFILSHPVEIVVPENVTIRVLKGRNAR